MIMDQKKNNWQFLSLPFTANLHEALMQQYHASQYLARPVGKHLVPQRDDDSNTNFRYQHEGGMFIGNELQGGIRVGLKLESLELLLLNPDNQVISMITPGRNG